MQFVLYSQLVWWWIWR